MRWWGRLRLVRWRVPVLAPLHQADVPGLLAGEGIGRAGVSGRRRVMARETLTGLVPGELARVISGVITGMISVVVTRKLTRMFTRMVTNMISRVISRMITRMFARLVDNVVAIKERYWLSRLVKEPECRVRGLRIGELVGMIAGGPGL